MRLYPNSLDPELEKTLRRTERRFQALRFWRWLGVLGLSAVALVLLLGVLMWGGLLRDTVTALILGALIFVVFLVGVPAVALAALATHRSREWSARQVEGANASLLDRLNTLVFLRSGGGFADESFDRRIERQAAREVLWAAAPFADVGRRNVRIWLAGLLLGVLTLAFYGKVRPYENLTSGGKEVEVLEPKVPEDPIVDAAEILDEEAEEEQVWGEVRITEPGRDLKVTKVEVVPLQIEAATSRPIEAAWWETAKSGEPGERRALPRPEEPRYAVYQPVLYVDELRLADWDVVTYHAAAAAGEGEYASEIYFLEVRPFREEIQKLRGEESSGGDDVGYDLLGEISGLIDRQKTVLRETHRFLAHGARPRADEALQRQDQEKLVAAEGEMADAASHLYAEIAAGMENMPVAEVLDALARAETELRRATKALAEDPPAAPPPEHAALAELVDTRKIFQRVLSQGGGGSRRKRPLFDDQLPVAEQMEKVAEVRDQEKAAQELVERVLEEQKRFAEEIEANPSQCSGLAPGHGKSAAALDQLARDHPRVFDGVRSETERAESALDKANEALEQGDAGAAAEAQAEALEALEELRDAVERQSATHQLADAYKMKELLDQQAERMGELEERGAEASKEDAAAAAEDARATTRGMKDLLEDTPAGELFGPELEDVLSDESQAERENRLDALAEAGGEERSPAAAAARRGLEELSQAFDEGAPELLRDLRREDPLGRGDREALDDALRQLRGLAERRGSPEQRREALENLTQGLKGVFGEVERVDAFLEEAEETLEEKEVDVERLRRLLEELDQFQREMGGVELDLPPIDLAHIDPSELPAEYRERIQRYFRRLSER